MPSSSFQSGVHFPLFSADAFWRSGGRKKKKGGARSQRRRRRRPLRAEGATAEEERYGKWRRTGLILRCVSRSVSVKSMSEKPDLRRRRWKDDNFLVFVSRIWKSNSSTNASESIKNSFLHFRRCYKLAKKLDKGKLFFCKKVLFCEERSVFLPPSSQTIKIS